MKTLSREVTVKSDKKQLKTLLTLPQNKVLKEFPLESYISVTIFAPTVWIQNILSTISLSYNIDCLINTAHFYIHGLVLFVDVYERCQVHL